MFERGNSVGKTGAVSGDDLRIPEIVRKLARKDTDRLGRRSRSHAFHAFFRDKRHMRCEEDVVEAHPLDQRPIELRARSAVFSSLADAILVSGPITGQPVNQSDLRKVAEMVKDVPIFANTGVNIDNVADILGVAQGVIVGTHFKVDGSTWNPVDGSRAKRFMDKVATLR